MRRFLSLILFVALCALTSGAQQAGTLPSGGGTASQAVAPNQNVIYASPNCGTQTNCFPVKDNGFQDTTCNWANTSSTVNCTDGPFTAAMVGERIAGYATCSTDAAAYANTLGSQSGTIISSYVSTTQIIASNPATGTQASAGCIYVASMDDAGFTAVEAAADASPTCPAINLPAGIMGTKEPHFTSLPAACEKEGRVTGIANAAPMFEVDGQGSGVSMLWWPPDFDLAACTVNTSVCMNIRFTRFHGWGITGGGLPTTSVTNKAIVSMFPGNALGFLDNWSCINFGLLNPTSQLVGLNPTSYEIIATNTVLDGCGDISVGDPSGTLTAGTLFALNSSFQDSSYITMQLVNFNSMGRNYFGLDATQQNNTAVFYGGNISLAPLDFVDNNGAPAGNRWCWWTKAASETFISNGATCNIGAGIAATFWASPTIKLQNTSITGLISTDQTTAKFFDYGNNTLTDGLSGPWNVFGSASITGTTQTTANVALTSGWGTSPSVSAASGNSQRESFTITVGTTPSANPVATVTFPTPFLATPICSVKDSGGTNPFLNATMGTVTTTTAAVDVVGTPTGADTITFVLSCSN